MTATIVHVGVVRDADGPDEDVSPLIELMPMRQRPLERGLHQIVGGVSVEHQRPRISTQTRYGAKQLLAKGDGSFHFGSTSPRPRLFRRRPDRRFAEPERF